MATLNNSHHGPLISVIVNCFNGEKYLNEALMSVLSQSYNNWEVIFWDNQSIDNSTNIVLSYNDHSEIQSLSFKVNGANFCGTQYHPEFNFEILSKILCARKSILISENIFKADSLKICGDQ